MVSTIWLKKIVKRLTQVNRNTVYCVDYVKTPALFLKAGFLYQTTLDTVYVLSKENSDADSLSKGRRFFTKTSRRIRRLIFRRCQSEGLAQQTENATNIFSNGKWPSLVRLYWSAHGGKIAVLKHISYSQSYIQTTTQEKKSGTNFCEVQIYTK